MEPLDPFVIRMKQDEDEVLKRLSFLGEFYLLKNGRPITFYYPEGEGGYSQTSYG
jgi:hypothetical protein